MLAFDGFMDTVRTLCLVAVAALAQACAAQEPTLTIQGDEYKSACALAERDALKQQIAEAAAGRREEVLATLVFTTLCGKDSMANEAVRHASIKSIKLTSTSTGSEKAIVTTIARTDLNAYASAVWNASVETDRDDVNLHFYKNEACIEPLTFKNPRKTWWPAAIAQACD